MGTSFTLRSGVGVLLLAVCLSGCHRQTVQTPDLNESPRLAALHRRASAFAQKGAFAEAAAAYNDAYTLAQAEHRPALASRYLANLGSLHYARLELRSALGYYLRALDLAQQARDMAGAGGISSNLASLYLQMGNFSAARAGAERGLRQVGETGPGEERAPLLMFLGLAEANGGEDAKAEETFARAIDEAARTRDGELLAMAWDYLGFERLSRFERTGRGSLESAERALLASYRLQRLFHYQNQATTYSHLSELREQQGDAEGARSLLERAMEKTSAEVPAWYLHFQSARLFRMQGRREEALGEFRRAIGEAGGWRDGSAPTDAFRSAASNWRLPELYSQFIDVLIADPNFIKPGSVAAAEAFHAAEEQRSAALRQTLVDWRRRPLDLPDEYWRTLGQIREVRMALLSHGTPELRASAAALRQSLEEIEARSLSPLGNTPAMLGENFSPGNTLSDIQRRLSVREVLLSFHFGSAASCVWAVTRDGFEAHRLQKAPILSLAEKFQVSVKNESAESGSTGRALYAGLFGQLSATAGEKPAWVLTSEETLMRTPLVALRSGTGPGPYLAERHSIRFIPSAFLVGPDPGQRKAGGSFLGIGDGIYNRADARWSRPLANPGSAQAAMELPRLVGSGRELYACARAWGGSAASVLTGAGANRAAVVQAFQTPPAVVHIAAHVLDTGGSGEDSVIALGLNRDGSEEVLTHYDVARLPMAGGTVVMSGCSSAAASSPEPTGILGLARAWLVAGAGSVVGTRWAYPDDTGALFQVFYRRLREDAGAPGGRGVAEALQAAEIQMIRSGSWRASPKYWASFYTIGKD